jgi:hypothetical protein
MRLVSSGALLCALASMAGCESAPPPPPPPPPLAVAPPPPPVLLPRGVVELASIYQSYIKRASVIDPSFNNADAVATSLKTGEGYEIDQFQRGQTAFGAIVALQDPTFLATLREYAKDAGRRSQVANRLMSDPSYAATFKGADSAAGLVIAAFSEHGQALLATGAKIHQAAYDVQHQPWSKADVLDRPGRLALAKALSGAQQKAIEVDAVQLEKNADGSQPMGLTAPPAAPPYTPLVARSLAVAAMAAIGQGGEEYSPQLTALLAESNEGQCLKMAKLNLYQCLAVSKPHYEDVFCLGQHAVQDTGQCIMKSSVAGYAPPVAIKPTPVADVQPQGAKKPAAVKKKKAASAG